MLVEFDHGQGHGPARFSCPDAIISAESPEEIGEAFDQLDQARADGFWLAGYASYELGYALEPKLAEQMPSMRKVPLMRFGVYREATQRVKRPGNASAALGSFQPRWSETQYAEAFDRLHAAIGAGDVYQGNLTFPMDAWFKGDPVDLYDSLSAYQPVGHGALVLQEDAPAILSRSPELFFRISSDGVITTKPMKGTQPRSPIPEEDLKHADFLRADEKNRAENLMIVDLLRNDISRICQAGSVHVPKLFDVETYATVHQMVSEVQGNVLSNVRVKDIFSALFPCGSITGAPKIRAMQILSELEPWPRDIYCGTIGWMAPDGRADFNVAIRTLLVDGDRATLNVGGGVVWDSTAQSEYEEALWKSRFAQNFLTAAA